MFEQLDPHIEELARKICGYRVMMLHGQYYAVFKTELELTAFDKLWPEAFDNCYTVSFDGRNNAFLMGTVH